MLLTACEHPADVIFALDSSGSIEEENYYIMENFVRDVIASLDITTGTRVGLITFSARAKVCTEMYAGQSVSFEIRRNGSLQATDLTPYLKTS